MPTDGNSLGGRVELIEPSQMTPDQKELYDSTMKEAVPWAQSSGFIAALPDGRVVGPFNLALQSPKIGAAFARLQSTEESKTTLSPRVRQVVILTIGALWRCDYERYAHRAVAHKLGLTPESIDALAEGAAPKDLTEDELLASQVTKRIATDHKLPDDLFRKAQMALGNQGIVDLLILAGCYVTVCSLLNSFEVPVPRADQSR
jgi:4-carboxymuconolactone decarboxylase